MAWEAEDADANRQGLTIAEYGEPGGPGMGGCPNGPRQSGPAAPTNISAAKTAGGLKLNMDPRRSHPRHTGHHRLPRRRRGQDVDQQRDRWKSASGSPARAATGTTITGLSANEEYDVYVVGVSSSGETFPAAHAFRKRTPRPRRSPPRPTAEPPPRRRR